MAAEEKPAPRGSLATVVATAAVTLAIGVTAAALGGYLVPGSRGETTPQAVVEPASAPSVVLVPVAREPRVEPPQILPAQPDPEVVLAAYEHDDGDDDEDHDDDHDEDHDEDDD